MFFTHAQTLRHLLEEVSNPESSKTRKLRAAQLLQKRFPPKRRTDLYACIIRDSHISDHARWVAMLMLYYVGNEAAVRGFIAFLEDPQMPRMLKLNAATLLLSLNPRLKFKEPQLLPKFPMQWLTHGLSQLPSASETERRDFVIDQLLIDLFEEGSD